MAIRGACRAAGCGYTVESLFVKPPRVLAGAKLLTYHVDRLPLKLRDVVELLARPARDRPLSRASARPVHLAAHRRARRAVARQEANESS